MRLEDILERNRSFVAGRPPQPLPQVDSLDLAVVTCYDPRLDELLFPALGLAPGGAVVIRTAGALVQPEGAALRSLALATFMFGVTGVVVVGHASCRMASFSTSTFIDAFRRRNVSREAFGTGDLRTWAGAIPDPRRGVQQSVANILAAPVLPKDLQVAGLLLDEVAGTLEVVVRPGEGPAAGAAVPAAPLPSEPAGVPPEPEIRTPAPGTEAPVAGPVPSIPGKPRGLSGKAPDPVVAALAGFVQTLQAEAGLGEELGRLRAELERQQSPAVRLGLVESFIRRAAAQSRQAAEAYRRLRDEVAAVRRRWDPQEVVSALMNLGRKP